MFDKKYKYQEGAKEVRQVKKTVPFTVTSHDRHTWRAEQACKEVEWQKKKAEHREKLVEAVANGMRFGGHYESEAYKARKKVTGAREPVKAFQKAPLFQRLMLRFINWFTNLPF